MRMLAAVDLSGLLSGGVAAVTGLVCQLAGAVADFANTILSFR